jgi:iron complex transport system substrate-binding protein
MRHALCLLLLVAVIGCEQSVPMPDAPSPRLVTFSPALTRITFDMGLGDHVVGVSGYSRLPEGQTRPFVGDTLNVRIEPILAVKPDILLVQMDISYFEPLQRTAPDIRVEHFTIETLSDIAAAIERIGFLVGNSALGTERSKLFNDKLDAVRALASPLKPVPVLFVLGYQNPSGPGADTFTDQMITLAGGQNVLANQFKGWKNFSLESIIKLAPAVIVCQCKPDERADAEAYWKALRLDGPAPQRVIIVTDDDWTLPADQLADYTRRLASFIHPEIAPPEPAP